MSKSYEQFSIYIPFFIQTIQLAQLCALLVIIYLLIKQQRKNEKLEKTVNDLKTTIQTANI